MLTGKYHKIVSQMTARKLIKHFPQENIAHGFFHHLLSAHTPGSGATNFVLIRGNFSRKQKVGL